MDLLKLLALDEEDLNVLSAHLQDAIVRVEDMAFVPREGRFAAIIKRFDWLSAATPAGSNGSGYERRQSALRFEKVTHAQFKGIDLAHGGDALELLAIEFALRDAPAGEITLVFAGGAAIKLHVDCIEAELRDLGPVWRTSCKPAHPDVIDQKKAAS